MTKLQCTKTARLLVFIVLLSSSGLSLSEEYAFLVGVGEFPNMGTAANLEGIDKDLLMMDKLIRKMGVKERNITIFYNEQADYQSVVGQFQLLAKTLKLNDSLLIYISTHGVQVDDASHDESDGLDEVLAFYDLNTLPRTEGVQLQGIIRDDELSTLLGAIQSQNKLLIVDACHSGTVDKSLSLSRSSSPYFSRHGKALIFNDKTFNHGEIIEKSLFSNQSELNVQAFDDVVNSHTVLLSATRDDQKALPSVNGSLFTQALVAVYDSLPVNTPFCWHNRASAWLREKDIDQQTPIFKGDYQLLHSPIGIDSQYAQNPLDNMQLCLQ